MYRINTADVPGGDEAERVLSRRDAAVRFGVPLAVAVALFPLPAAFLAHQHGGLFNRVTPGHIRDYHPPTQ